MAASSNILIVDDDPDIRQVLKILLSETYTVAEASSGMEAVAYVKEHPELDLVLLDVMMPGMDGFQTCDARTPTSPFCSSPRSPPRTIASAPIPAAATISCPSPSPAWSCWPRSAR